jgi:hypothetical protein
MKVNRDVKSNELWEYYRKNASNPLSRREWSELLFSKEGVIKELTNQIIYNSALITLPHNMGSIYIEQKIPKAFIKNGKIVKSRSLVIDWGSTNKMWKDNPQAKKEKKFIYYFNAHTRGLKYKIVWEKESEKLKLKRHVKFYKFNSHRSYDGTGFRETLTKHIKSPDFSTVYFEKPKN